MTKFNDIFEIAADSHGLITSKQASAINITSNELVQYAKRGRLEKVGHGLYKLVRWIPEQNDAYAWAVEVVGEDALLYGESVLAMLELTPTNPNYMHIATPRRTRRKLPGNFRVKRIEGINPGAYYDGIPSQSVYDAILSCKMSIIPERLIDAARKAKMQGFITESQYRTLKAKIGCNNADKETK